MAIGQVPLAEKFHARLIVVLSNDYHDGNFLADNELSQALPGQDEDMVKRHPGILAFTLLTLERRA